MIRHIHWDGARLAARSFATRSRAPFSWVVTARVRASRRWAVAAFLALTTAFQAADVSGAYRWGSTARLPDISVLFGPRQTTATDWWSHGVFVGKLFHLDPGCNSADPFRLFQLSTQRFGWQSWPSQEPIFAVKNRWVSDLYWHVDENEVPDLDGTSPQSNWLSGEELPDFAGPLVPSPGLREPFDGAPNMSLGPLLTAPKPTIIPVVTRGACPVWRTPQKIAFSGLAGEGDRFALVDCDGVVSADAIDRLSVVGRQPGTAIPPLPLPLSPETNLQFRGEWVDGVRLLHPRLLGLIQQITSAFPGHGVAVYSGYRRDARSSSPHLRGRALDIALHNVANVQLFAFCRTLHEAGCGYYPNQPFVHVDVREPTRGSVSWVDISMPGQPSHYTEAWPIRNGELDSPDTE